MLDPERVVISPYGREMLTPLACSEIRQRIEHPLSRELGFSHFEVGQLLNTIECLRDEIKAFNAPA